VHSEMTQSKKEGTEKKERSNAHREKKNAHRLESGTREGENTQPSITGRLNWEKWPGTSSTGTVSEEGGEETPKEKRNS